MYQPKRLIKQLLSPQHFPSTIMLDFSASSLTRQQKHVLPLPHRS